MIIELPDPSFDLRHTVSTIEDGDTEPKKEKQDEHFPLTSPLTVCVCVCVWPRSPARRLWPRQQNDSDVKCKCRPSDI